MPVERKIATIASDAQALLFAAEQNNTVAIISLLARGADRFIKNQDNKTPIEIVAEKQNWKALFAFAKYKTDAQDSGHYNQALIIAIRHNQFNLAYALLLANASPNAHQQFKSDQAGEEGDECAHLAVRNNNPPLIQLLYRFGADFSAKNKKEALTPYLLACQLGLWKETVSAIWEIDDFEETRLKLIAALNTYSDYRPNSGVKKRLIAACQTDVKNIKEIIALLELHINLFDSQYCARHFRVLTKEEKQTLPLYVKPIRHRKDKFYQIIKNFHQKLMEHLLHEEQKNFPAENINLFFAEQKAEAPPSYNPYFNCEHYQIKQ